MGTFHQIDRHRIKSNKLYNQATDLDKRVYWIQKINSSTFRAREIPYRYQYFVKSIENGINIVNKCMRIGETEYNS